MLTCNMILLSLITIPAAAQDAAVVNPKIVKVEFDNDRVRILRALYKPHDRLEMHSHPAKAEVQFTDGSVRIFTPDGKWQDAPGKAGEFFWLEPTKHAVENTGDASVELVEIEMKNVSASSPRLLPGDSRYMQGTQTPYTHRVKNVGSTPFHVIDIELHR